MKSETSYLLRRASEEARLAMGSAEPKAADVHEALSVRYSARALSLLVAEDEGAAAPRSTDR
jgi:hypothetical protein